MARGVLREYSLLDETPPKTQENKPNWSAKYFAFFQKQVDQVCNTEKLQPHKKLLLENTLLQECSPEFQQRSLNKLLLKTINILQNKQPYSKPFLNKRKGTTMTYKHLKRRVVRGCYSHVEDFCLDLKALYKEQQHMKTARRYGKILLQKASELLDVPSLASVTESHSFSDLQARTSEGMLRYLSLKETEELSLCPEKNFLFDTVPDCLPLPGSLPPQQPPSVSEYPLWTATHSRLEKMVRRRQSRNMLVKDLPPFRYPNFSCVVGAETIIVALKKLISMEFLKEGVFFC